MSKTSISLIKGMKIYLHDCRINEQSERTIEGKLQNLQQFIRWHIVNYGSELNEVTKDSIDDYKSYLLDYQIQRTELPIDKATRRNKITAVRTFIRTMFELDYLAENVSMKVRLPKSPKRVVKAILQADEVMAIAAQTRFFGDHGMRDLAILAVFFACGLRRGEVGKLKLNSLNANAGTLFIEQAKGDKDRIVPIAEGTIKIVQYYLEHIRPKLVTFESGDYLFINNKGSPYKGSQLTDLVSKYKRRAGVNKPGSSKLYRHTTATTMLDNGADIRVIQEVLGHESISTTQIYTHVAVKKMCSVYSKTHPAALQNNSSLIDKNDEKD